VDGRSEEGARRVGEAVVGTGCFDPEDGARPRQEKA